LITVFPQNFLKQVVAGLRPVWLFIAARRKKSKQ